MGCCFDSERGKGRKSIPNVENNNNNEKENIFDISSQKNNKEDEIIKNNNHEIFQSKIDSIQDNKIQEKKEENIEKIKIVEIMNKTEKVQEKRITKNKEKLSALQNKELLKFNKELCKSIASSLPKREETNYQSLKNIMKSKTEKLSDKEKSYIIFLWICDNISYDIDSYYAGRSVDCSPEGVFRNGSSVCSGYSRLYKDFSLYINLEVESVNCYAKGVSYKIGQKMTKTNHEYNVIKLNNKWYPIDSTWGAGHVDGKNFIKSYNEFYFLADPELLIKTHFPADDKWQLTQKKYTLDEFLKWPQVESNFYKYGFQKYFPEEGMIVLKNKNIQKFIIYGNNIKQKAVTCDIYLLEQNCYKQQLNLSMVNRYKDRFEINAIFNKKGKYRVQIYGKDDKEEKFFGILKYAINVENDAKEQFKFPITYDGKENINVIEPLYDNIKSGEIVKFKMTSNFDDIIIIDNQWHYLKKNDEGYFELETKIKSQKGKNVIIGYKKSSGSCGYLVVFKVI